MVMSRALISTPAGNLCVRVCVRKKSKSDLTAFFERASCHHGRIVSMMLGSIRSRRLNLLEVQYLCHRYAHYPLPRSVICTSFTAKWGRSHRSDTLSSRLLYFYTSVSSRLHRPHGAQVPVNNGKLSSLRVKPIRIGSLPVCFMCDMYGLSYSS